ncbi:DNA methyltransferase [Nostoc linckia z7]|uniref:DNA (cytosine-5-)-methyltransferase n=2 Tax=Nostoc linckia TaxID=92942 RepID=A0A9Q5ZGL8_NOSLI|nr:DNA methyltransferase [Nostoc linckia z1]PHJ70197.1 DNA methyltransferase [Nostoc linckia z3]PHJ75131.1 DNA methyltransferase [Nostoc linckia z2]PHJ83052.1 DNA methyltransferase [Nostoc linckia z4]PHJ89149.1 DNA methyltransferase [Nostoc linckia z6]PHK00179.1 DNA methyltransferase [Nostoc linckia z7]PHK06821.1 DNA methyltransferase [Nostoc linckia z8]PHK23264.1 DNA methyltransferase [Nostoc linckia z14]PHK27048.1 DNA methyltransferase [Nostoc linckia z13]PHK43008.1 DNA methyltransferase
MFLEKETAQNSQQAGCLYQYLESKKLKDGSTIEYPKVVGERDPNNPQHWRWGFNWKEKQAGKWKGKSIGSIPHSAIAQIRTMQEQGAKREEIVSFVLQAKEQIKTPNPLLLTPNPLSTTTPIAVVLFAGGGGIESGMVEAGIRPVVAVECDPTKPKLSSAIADCHQLNFRQYGCKVVRQTVQQVAASNFIGLPLHPDYFHASLVCSRFSKSYTAKAGHRGESQEDISAAQAVGKAITKLLPAVFTLENVPGYIESQSFETVVNALNESGYSVTYEIIDFADYGLPQSRKRVILTAGLGFNILLPPPSNKRMGWYEAVAYLIPTMPDSKLLTSQQKVVDEFLLSNPPQPLLIQRTGIRDKKPKYKPGHLPCNTIVRSQFTDDKGHNRTKFADIWLPNGMVKSLTIQAAAILQGFPSWYEFPAEVATAGSIIGYSVPPSFAKLLFVHCEQERQKYEGRGQKAEGVRA